ncbi:hypothetical protein DL93DRAFT_307514 [Clavulina sp. PMI_390]|nr:hypothetical protein DL93DRAFT_307514 [Clavulina sp. PMI_390]
MDLSSIFPSTPRVTCGEAYQYLESKVAPDDRFGLALHLILPAARGESFQLDTLPVNQSWPIRIICSYALYRMYAPHAMALNPFLPALQETLGNLTQAPSGLVQDKSRELLKLIIEDSGDKLDGLRPYEIFSSINHEPPTYSAANQQPERDPDHLALQSSLRGIASPNSAQPNVTIEPILLLTDAQSRVLTLSEQKTVLKAINEVDASLLAELIPPDRIDSLVENNARIAALPIMRILSANHENAGDLETYIDSIGFLGPRLSSFDLIGNLLKLEREFEGSELPNLDGPSRRGLVRSIVVERFLANCLQAINEYEREDEGNELDDQGRTARSIVMLSKFAIAILRSDGASSLPASPAPQMNSHTAATPIPTAAQGKISGPVHPEPLLGGTNATTPSFSEALDVELTNFALQHSRFVEANTLYRALASRFVYPASS